MWNTRIDRLPTDSQSSAYIASIGANRQVHPDFGADPANGISYNLVPPGTQPLPVVFDFQSESDNVSYPIPPNPLIEGGADHHLVLIDTDQCILYELFAAQQQSNGAWTAGSGIKMYLNSDVLRPAGFTSADAAGLPLFPGLIRYDEVAAGQINHALRFTVPHTRNTYVWPARHQASNSSSPALPPMGTRFRLRADFDISGLPTVDKVIMTALKRYGMFVADNGSAMYISGVPDPRWNDDDLHQLNRVTAEDFEAVDESGLQLSPDSARANSAVANQ